MPSPLDEIRRFVELPEEIEMRLREAMHTTHFNRGDTITATNDMRNNAFYISQGMARIFYIRNGKEHTYSFTLENQFLILSNYILDSEEMVVGVEFLEPTDMIFVSHAQIRAALQSVDATQRHGLTAFATTAMFNYTSYLEDRLLMMQNTSASQRYEWLCRRYPKILERATTTQLASFLGVTRETLYRIRAGKYPH